MCALSNAIRSASVRTGIGAGLPFRYLAMSALSSVRRTGVSFLPIALVVELLDVDEDRALLAQDRERGLERGVELPKLEAKRITPIRLPLSELASSAAA